MPRWMQNGFVKRKAVWLPTVKAGLVQWMPNRFSGKWMPWVESQIPFGRFHGAAFLIYFFVAIITAMRLRWSWWGALLAVQVCQTNTAVIEM